MFRCFDAEPNRLEELLMATEYLLRRRMSPLQFCTIFWHNRHAVQMMKYLFSTALIFLWLCPTQAQDNRTAVNSPTAELRIPTVESLVTGASTTYMNQLALRGFSLQSQGV